MTNLFYDRLANTCHELLLTSSKLMGYLTDTRKLSIETINSYNLGAFPKDLRKLFSHISPEELKKEEVIWNADTSPFQMYPIVIPVRDFRGNTVAIGCRSLLSESKRKDLGIPKYRNTSYAKTSHLFGLDKAFQDIRIKDKVFVVEGYFDVITAHQNGFKNVVATCGTMFKYRQLLILSRYTNNICLLFDNDSPGRVSAKKVMQTLENSGANLTCAFTPDKFKDLDEFLKNGGNLSLLDFNESRSKI